MIIRPAPGFGVNGKMQGTLIALEDDGVEPLGWESYSANWSSETHFERAVKGLASSMNIPPDRARIALTAARREARRQAGMPEAAAPPEHQKPTIVTSNRYVRDVIDQSWAALMAQTDPPVFFRSGNTVVYLERDTTGTYPSRLRREGLAAHLDRLADYIRFTDKGEEVASHPSRTVTEEMLSMISPDLPELRSISATPVLGIDGEVISNTGYYSSLGMYLDLREVSIPKVPQLPSREDLAEARRLLLDELLGDFPWISKADCTNIVSMPLERVLRPHYNSPSPLKLVEAPGEGSGKGLCAQVICLLATGTSPTIMTEARSEEEMRKRITATLSRAPQIILIDNVQKPLDSAALSAVLTATIWEDRDLGYTRTVRIPVSCGWMVTGNNVVMSGEISRRVVPSRMDSGVARPWERSGPKVGQQWRHNPLETWVAQERGRLLWALLVIARAWYVAGKPRSTVRMGSYDDWAAVVGGALETAGIQGLLTNRERLYASSVAEVNDWEAMVEAWWAVHGGQKIGIGDLHRLAKEQELLGYIRAGRTDQGARIALGKELTRMRDRRIARWYIRDAGRLHGGAEGHRLEICADPQKPYPSSPSYTDPVSISAEGQSQFGEGGEDGEDFSAPAQVFDQNVAPGIDDDGGGHFGDFAVCICPDADSAPLPQGQFGICSSCDRDEWCPGCGGCLACRKSEVES